MGSVATMFPVFHCALFAAAFTAANADTVTVRLEEETRGNCPDGWFDTGLFGGRMGCPLFNSTASYTWDRANEYCYSQEGELVEIRQPQEMEFLMSYLLTLENHETAYDWWTAGMDVGREGRWIWPSSLANVQSYVWDVDDAEPDGGARQNCLILGHKYSYKGHDWECEKTLKPICQKK